MPIPVIYDNDIGTDVDDLWALALMLALPELDLRVVTVMSNDPPARARLAAKSLRLAGREDVLVGQGGRVPLRYRDDPDAWSPNNTPTHCDLVTADDPEAGKGYPDAVALMIETLERSPEPMGIVGTGIWTNLAALLETATPKVLAKIRFLSLMGAEVDIVHRENNVVLDPEAADIVLRSGIPTFVGTWSVTRQLYYPQAEAEALIGGMSPSPWRDFFLDATRRWREKTGTGKPGPVLYDAIPVFFAAGRDPRIQTFPTKELNVELEGKYTRGLTTLPGASRWSYWAVEKDAGVRELGDDPARPILVSYAMDAAALKRGFSQRVFGYTE